MQVQGKETDILGKLIKKVESISNSITLMCTLDSNKNNNIHGRTFREGAFKILSIRKE